MEYKLLADTYARLEATTKRLEMTDILVELFKNTPVDLIDRVVYLTQGEVFPSYEGLTLGLAEKMVVKALSRVAGFPEGEVEKSLLKVGDMGEVTEDFLSRKRQMALFHDILTVERVYSNFVKIATAEGQGSSNMKIKLLEDLLHDAEPLEGKYIVRTVLGRLRLGIADMTILDALAIAFATRDDRPLVEEAYNHHPALGDIAKLLATEGVEGLVNVKVTPGIPVRVMLAERLRSIDEILTRMGGRFIGDYKYDGIRIQAHILPDGGIVLYSRRMEDLTPQFPDVVEALRGAFRGKNGIVEGECVPVDINTGEMLPFQMVSHRRGRKYDLEKAVEEYPVCLFLFDALYLDDNDITHRPYPERRKALENAFQESDRVKFSTIREITDVAAGEAFFIEALDAGCEGIIAKSVAEDSIYRAGSRGFLWIKYKKDYKSEMTDTVDLVAVGAFAGKGKRAGKYGSLLMATYNSDTDTFETVCKLASGFNDEFMDLLDELIPPLITESCDPRVRSDIEPDFWLRPNIVLEVIGAEITHSPVHTCAYGVLKENAGLAIRFPRYTGRLRDDKSPEDATTTAEVIEMYTSQTKTV